MDPPIYPVSYHLVSPTIPRWVPLRAIDINALRNLGIFDNGKPIHHILNHPIKWVRITGVVVAVDEFAERRILTVDDSSGSCVECVCAVPFHITSKTTSSNAKSSCSDQYGVQMASTNRLKSSSHQFRGRRDEGNGKDAQKEVDPKENSSGQPCTQNPQIPWESIDVGTVLKIKGQITTFRDIKQVEVIKIDIIAGTEGEVRCWEEVLKFRREVLSRPWVVTQEEANRCAERARKEEKKRKSKASEKTKAKAREGDFSDPPKKINDPSVVPRRGVAGKHNTFCL